MKPFTVNSLAERWDCSATFVYNLVAAGGIPSFKIGGKLIRIRHVDVEVYEQGNLSIEPDDITSEDTPADCKPVEYKLASSHSARHIARMIRLKQ